MRLEEAVNQYLQAKLNNRLYPQVLPQKVELPAVAYTSVSIERLHALNKDTGFAKHRLQFACYAKALIHAVETSELIRAQLQDFSGDMSGIYIGGVLIMSETSDYESATGLYCVRLEFEFQYEEVNEHGDSR